MFVTPHESAYPLGGIKCKEVKIQTLQEVSEGAWEVTNMFLILKGSLKQVSS